MTEFLSTKLAAILESARDPWIIIGFVGTFIFASRFIIQWIVSERKRRSVIPTVFWYLSIVGSLFSLTYSFHKADIVFIFSYMFNCLIYIRNLYLIEMHKKEADNIPTATSMIRGEWTIAKSLN